jgi:predicted SAM-dependent methyltransferase
MKNVRQISIFFNDKFLGHFSLYEGTHLTNIWNS